MASNKSGITNVKGGGGSGLAGALLKIVAAGVTGGVLLIAGAKSLGEKIEEKQLSDYEKLEKQREADREAVRKITAAEEFSEE